MPRGIYERRKRELNPPTPNLCFKEPVTDRVIYAVEKNTSHLEALAQRITTVEGLLRNFTGLEPALATKLNAILQLAASMTTNAERIDAAISQRAPSATALIENLQKISLQIGTALSYMQHHAMLKAAKKRAKKEKKKTNSRATAPRP